MSTIVKNHPGGGADRRVLVADSALTVLAERGARGLTHRAVDEAAGLPSGATSNVFRSRAALLEGALERHVELDLTAAGAPADPDFGELSRERAAALLVAAVEGVLGRRELTVARYELLLESTRRPEFRDRIATARSRFRELSAAILIASGCSEPTRHARQLLAVLDGIVVADLHGEDAALSHDEIAELVERTLASC